MYVIASYKRTVRIGQTAVAVKGIILIDVAVIECIGHRHRLGRGARFIGIVDAEIFPYLVAQFALFLIGHRIKQFIRITAFTQIIRVVEVKARRTRHGQDLPVIRVHDQGGNMIRSRLTGKFVQLVLADSLQVHINRGNDRIAIRRLLRDLFLGHIILHVRIRPSVGAGQIAVIVVLKSPEAAAVTGCKTDHIRGKSRIRIIPLVVHLKPDRFLAEKTHLVFILLQLFL